MSASTGRLVSVNRGSVEVHDWAGRLGRTAIDKRPVDGPVAVGRLGLEGDEVADAADHGGPDQAVYVYAQEDLDHWARQVGLPLTPGMFGENLTTAGIDVNEALVGERWQVGEPGVGPLLEVASVRRPCRVFANFLALHGVEATGWVRRFTVEGRPGPYLRVLETGTVTVGDPVEVVHVPAHALTVRRLLRALTTEPELMAEVLAVPGIGERVRADAARRVSG